jgi:predicted RNA-binding Zn ribbon-like protein
MNPLFLGSHQATDFLNTLSRSQGRVQEFIPDGVAFVQWLRLADLLSKEHYDSVIQQFSARQLNLVAERARTEREWVRAWLAKLCAGSKSNYAQDAAHLNHLINLCRFKFALTGKPVRTGPTCAVERYPVLDRPDTLLGLVAEPIAHLVACEDLKLIRRCAQDNCSHWFLDTTRSHKRLYCSASTCGNRAKVAAFRARALALSTPRKLTRN